MAPLSNSVLSHDLLYDLYVNQRLTITQIRDRLQVNRSRLVQAMREHGIPMRPTGGAARIKDPVPTSVVAPVLIRLYEEFTGETFGESNRSPGSRETGGWVTIALRCNASRPQTSIGAWTAAIRGIVTQRQAVASITYVDHILAAFNATHLWYEDPLCEHYFAGVAA